LPESLTKLEFGHYFNQQILENTLPMSLTELTFGKGFNQRLKRNNLPSSLVKLGLCKKKNYTYYYSKDIMKIVFLI